MVASFVKSGKRGFAQKKRLDSLRNAFYPAFKAGSVHQTMRDKVQKTATIGRLRTTESGKFDGTLPFHRFPRHDSAHHSIRDQIHGKN
jgi:hypothetical protein